MRTGGIGLEGGIQREDGAGEISGQQTRTAPIGERRSILRPRSERLQKRGPLPLPDLLPPIDGVGILPGGGAVPRVVEIVPALCPRAPAGVGRPREMARRFVRLAAEQGEPTQPLGSGRQQLSAEGGGHQVRITGRQFQCGGDFLARAVRDGTGSGVQTDDGGEYAQRRGHGLGRRVLRALPGTLRPGFDSLVELGDRG